MSLLVFIALAMVFTAIPGVQRLMRGPTLTDRVIGLDLLFAIAIIYCLLASWSTGRTVFVDVAIGLAITGFIATLSWARLIQVQSDRQGEKL